MTAGKAVLPVVVHREIRTDDANTWLSALENGGVRRVLVDRRDIEKAAAQEPGDQVLSNQPGGTSHYDARIFL
jgi:hypothetical protein